MAREFSSNIMSVGEMIDTAFGDPDVNTVNLKLVQTILYILARQLRVLERQVEIEIGHGLQPSSSSLSITEVKIHAMQKKTKRPAKLSSKTGAAAGGGTGQTGGEAFGQTGGRGFGKTPRGIWPLRKEGQPTSVTQKLGPRIDTEKSSTDKSSSQKTATDKTSSDKTSTGKTALGKTTTDKPYSDKTATDKISSDKSTTDKTYSSDKTSSDKPSSEMTTSDKTSSDKTTSDRISSDKTTTDKTSSAKTSSDKTTTDNLSSDKTSSDKTSSAKTSSDKTSSDKTTTDIMSSDKTTSDKISSDKTTTDKTSSAKTSSDKTTTENLSSDKTSSDKTSTDKTSSAKTSSDKTSSDKTTTDIISSDKTSTDKTSSAKTSTDKTSSDKTSTDKSSSDKTSTDKTSTDKTSTDKTSTDKTSSAKTSSDKTSSDKTTADNMSSDKLSSDKTSTDKTSTDKTSSDKTSSAITSSDKTSTAKSSSDKTSSAITSSDKTSTAKSSSDKTSSAITSSDKTSTAKSSSDKTSSDKTSSEKYSSSKSTTKTTSDKTSTEKSTSDTSSSGKRGPGDYIKLLEAVEEQREYELRVIHQLRIVLRADSREVRDKTPSPMASMDSVEATYEKLLVVERIPADEARAMSARDKSGARDKIPRLSVVTQDQFENLAAVVRQLQQKFGPSVGSSSFPENIKLMQELRKGASLTDAMAALQLSARLEATEKTLEQMLSLVTDLASKTPGIDITGETQQTGADMDVIFGASKYNKPSSEASPAVSHKSALKKKEPTQIPSTSSSEESIQISLPHSTIRLETSLTKTDGALEIDKEQPDRVTYEELDGAMQELYDDVIKMVQNLTAKSTVNADNAFKMASRIEGKLEASLQLGTKMKDLETLVSDYAVQVNTLDRGLSSQMTNFQEELTQMQHDLETALETMAEVLASAGGDTTAVAELNAQFSDLQSDIDDTMMRQKELRNTQNALSFDLESLRKQIEILREAKSDRDEVADALRDKAGLGALNGLVSLQQFGAVRGDFEKKIGIAFDKFNAQETAWQKAIDEVLRELNEKADWIQVVSLKEDINKHIENLRCKLHAMLEIVGEPRAAAVAKKLHRDAYCLSCATPADMNLEEPGTVPVLPSARPPTIGAEAKPKEDGDHGLCYPGRPIPHPRDPRSHVCQRWCGGSHTLVSNAVSRGPAGMIITPAQRKVTTALGTDGKAYMVDEPMKPCTQCNKPNTTPQPSEMFDEERVESDSDMTPSDFRPILGTTLTPPGDVTPPPPQDGI